jgi:hypothetical protein
VPQDEIKAKPKPEEKNLFNQGAKDEELPF